MIKLQEFTDIVATVRDLKNFLPVDHPARYELTAALWHALRAHSYVVEETNKVAEKATTNIIPFKVKT